MIDELITREMESGKVYPSSDMKGYDRYYVQAKEKRGGWHSVQAIKNLAGRQKILSEYYDTYSEAREVEAEIKGALFVSEYSNRLVKAVATRVVMVAAIIRTEYQVQAL